MGGFSISQMDNFLKLYWHLEYEDRMTTKKARDIVLSNRTWSVFLTVIYLSLTPENAMCQTSSAPICSVLKPSNYIWNMIIHSILYGVCIFVNLYCVKKVLKLQAAVAPIANLPVQYQIRPRPPKDEEIEVQDLEDLGSSRQQNVHTISKFVEENNPQIPNSVSKATNGPSLENNNVKRLNSHPNMFYRVRVSLKAPTININSIGMDRTKKILKVSLQFSCIILLLLPMNIVHSYLYFSGESCEENLGMVRLVSAPSWGLAFLAYMAIVFRKLYKISS